MKLRILFASLVLAAGVSGTAAAWGPLGHVLVVKIAERHLTPQAKAAIAKYMPYDLATDASWMDQHRRDKGLEYTSKWHGFHVNKGIEYYPGRISTGDVVTALQIADYNLRHRRNLSDSTIIMNLRMVLHFVGDLHCPTHALYDTHVTGKKTPVMWNGKKYKNFHSIYDKMPKMIYPDSNRPVEEIAAVIDNMSKSTARKIVAGSFYDWATYNARNCEKIYIWNPAGTTEINPDTKELSTELVNEQLRNGGYRLARLLNEYFN